MSKDVFSIFSDDGMHGATCIVSIEPDDRGRHEYRVINTTCGTLGTAPSLEKAFSAAKKCAIAHFKYQSISQRIRTLERELEQMKQVAGQNFSC